MKKINRDEEAIIATVSYADVFGYPMKTYEIWLYLIREKTNFDLVKKMLKSLSGNRYHVDKNAIYCLKGRKSLFIARQKRKIYSLHKWEIVYRISGILKYIPSVQLIGVSGGLSLDNADSDDDIDLFLIVSTGTIFISRLIVTLIIELISNRRHPYQIGVKNTVCLNMFMTDLNLTLALKEQNIYTAHEVIQMKPVYDRGGLYRDFISANKWVKKYMPNAWSVLCETKIDCQEFGININIYKWITINIFVNLMRLFEKGAKKIQLLYMRSKITREIIDDTILKFHPMDRFSWVKKEFKARLRKYNIPLDKFLFSNIK